MHCKPFLAGSGFFHKFNFLFGAGTKIMFKAGIEGSVGNKKKKVTIPSKTQLFLIKFNHIKTTIKPFLKLKDKQVFQTSTSSKLFHGRGPDHAATNLRHQHNSTEPGDDKYICLPTELR